VVQKLISLAQYGPVRAVSLASWTCRFAGCCFLAFEGRSAKAEIGAGERGLLLEVTNVFQIRQLAARARLTPAYSRQW
jgi:hypothetical protein